MIAGFESSRSNGRMRLPVTYAASAILALAFLLAGIPAGLAAPESPPVDLRPETMAAFERYVSLTDSRNAEELRRGTPFLWVDALPPKRRSEAYAAMERGEVMIEKVKTLEDGKAIKFPGGMIHDWVGAIFIPGATLAQTLALAQDYARHPQIYGPYELSSKILEHDGDHFKVSIRYLNKSLITVVLDVVFDIEYHTLDATHAWSRNQTISVRQVEDAGTPREKVLPEGEGGGYLWSMVTYSRYLERDGGTYVQSESIALSRSIPAILSWLIGPYARSIPRKVLTGVLEDTRKGVLHPPTS
jgi:hypothetical protein